MQFGTARRGAQPLRWPANARACNAGYQWPRSPGRTCRHCRRDHRSGQHPHARFQRRLVHEPCRTQPARPRAAGAGARPDGVPERSVPGPMDRCGAAGRAEGRRLVRRDHLHGPWRPRDSGVAGDPRAHPDRRPDPVVHDRPRSHRAPPQRRRSQRQRRPAALCHRGGGDGRVGDRRRDPPRDLDRDESVPRRDAGAFFRHQRGIFRRDPSRRSRGHAARRRSRDCRAAQPDGDVPQRECVGRHLLGRVAGPGGAGRRPRRRSSSSASAPTSPSAKCSKRSCARARRWTRSASWPAASRTISTIC